MSGSVVKALGIPELSTVAETLRWTIEDKLKEDIFNTVDLVEEEPSSEDGFKKSNVQIFEKNLSLSSENFVSTYTSPFPAVLESDGLATCNNSEFTKEEKFIPLPNQSHFKNEMYLTQCYGDDIKDFKCVPLQNVEGEKNLLYDFEGNKYDVETKTEDYIKCLVPYEEKEEISKNSVLVETCNKDSSCYPQIVTKEKREVLNKNISLVLKKMSICLNNNLTENLGVNEKKLKINHIIPEKVIRKNPVSLNGSDKELSTNKEETVSKKYHPLKRTNNGDIVNGSEESIPDTSDAPKVKKARVGDKEANTPLLKCVAKQKSLRRRKKLKPDVDKVCMMSPELAAVTGEEFLTRRKAFQNIWKYGRKHYRLVMHNSSPELVDVDDRLFELFKKKSLSYSFLRYFIYRDTSHIIEVK